jgi:glycosyltransferase involved in cell wall biosynthesis
MKIVLVGPYPPPHGGISVHLYKVRQQFHKMGIHCRVVNVDPHAWESDQYIKVRGGMNLFSTLFSYSRRGWALHVHTNGHNLKSWLITLTAGLAGMFGRANFLTLHSGLAPQYLAPGRRHPGEVRLPIRRWGARLLAWFSCLFYARVIAVSPEVRDALISVGVRAERTAVLPSFLFTRPPVDRFPLPVVEGRRPILGATLFFRPEYGFALLVDAVDQLRSRYPALVCLVMGSGEQQADAEKLVAQRGLQGVIRFLGNLEHEKCLSVMSQCDLFIRPALADGDANCVREALALGVPVVASTAGHRPSGTILFQSGNVADLVLKIEEAWSRPVAQQRAAVVGGESRSEPRMNGAGMNGAGMNGAGMNGAGMDGAGGGIERLIDLYTSIEEERNNGKTQPLTPHAGA